MICPCAIADRPEIGLLLLLAEVISRERLAADGHFQRVGLEAQADVFVGGTQAGPSPAGLERNEHCHRQSRTKLTAAYNDALQGLASVPRMRTLATRRIELRFTPVLIVQAAVLAVESKRLY